MDVERDLEAEMKKDAVVIDYCRDRALAVQFYAALCNMQWQVIKEQPEDEKIIDRLKGIDSQTWSCTWRYAGGIIADIRNLHLGTQEDYMDFYCSGNEGEVTDIVKECFERMGWKPKPWD